MEADRRELERGPAVLVLPEIVPARWWQHIQPRPLHTEALRL
jgi:hypothetical protein